MNLKSKLNYAFAIVGFSISISAHAELYIFGISYDMGTNFMNITTSSGKYHVPGQMLQDMQKPVRIIMLATAARVKFSITSSPLIYRASAALLLLHLLIYIITILKVVHWSIDYSISLHLCTPCILMGKAIIPFI